MLDTRTVYLEISYIVRKIAGVISAQLGRRGRLLNLIKNKIWGDKEEKEEKASDDDKKGHDLDESLNEVDRTDAFEEN